MATLPSRGIGLAARAVVVSSLLSLVLSGCVLDDEAAVRRQLAGWVVLGDTTYFKSQRQCTAGLFHTKGRNIKSEISKVRSIGQALRLIGKGRAVAFRLEGMTPGEVHKQLDLANRTIGLGMLTSGLGGRNCLTPALQDEFALALQGQDVIVLYDPKNHALALFERASKRVFYARGDVG
ncbi:MAG: hypothetical protein L3J36_04200 [Rhodobacteraceae bacterium]|nr:hypothetical protein [Paracoccaceae bacterium]